MTVSTFAQPDSTTEAPPAWGAKVDGDLAVLARLAGPFAAHEQATPDLTVRLDAGFVPTIAGVPATVAAQSTSSLTAPITDPRKDIVYIDAASGAVGVAAGSENASPVDPSVPAGKIAIARINWTTSMTEITNADLDDLRNLAFLGLGNALGNGLAVASGKIALDKAGLTDLGTGVDSANDYAFVWDATSSTWKISAIQNLAPGTDQVARDIAIAALIAATSTGGTRGPVVSWVADSDNFSTKTNATFDTDHYKNPGSYTSDQATGGTAIESSHNGSATASRAFDDNDTTEWAGNESGPNGVSYIGYDFGSGITKQVRRFTIKQADNGSTKRPVTSVKLRYSDDGSAWTVVSTHSIVGDTSLQSLDAPASSAHRYWSLLANSDTITAGQLWSVLEIEFIEYTAAPDMTLSDDAVTITTGADLVDVYVEEKTVDASPTRRIRASIDGGSTWATGTLSATYTFADKNLYLYECDVSAQTGTSLKIEYNTLADGKERNFYRLDAVPLYP